MSKTVLIILSTVLVLGLTLLVTNILSRRKKTDLADWEVGGRDLPYYVVIGTQFATAMGGGVLVGHVGNAYNFGLSILFYVKVVEVVPVNFLLRSAREQRSIIYSFISYLKIAPVKVQFKALTKRADINRHLDIRKHSGTILGELDHQVICVPPKTRFNGNLAVYGASGSKKTRAFCVNMILQCAARKSSLVICDPKSELYEKTSEYLRDQGYTVRVFNLVTPSASDSWNCLAEVGGQELMAQLFCDVIIKNTGGEERDHFWDSAEMNLLKALVLYVSISYPKEKQNIGEVYQLLTASSEQDLKALFDVLSLTHPAKAPYAKTPVQGRTSSHGARLRIFSMLF